MKYDKLYTVTAVFFLVLFSGFLCKVVFWPEPQTADAMPIGASISQTAAATQKSNEYNRMTVTNFSGIGSIPDEVYSENSNKESLFAQNTLGEISPIEISPSDSGSSTGFNTERFTQYDSVAASSVAASSDTASDSSSSPGSGSSNSSGTSSAVSPDAASSAGSSGVGDSGSSGTGSSGSSTSTDSLIASDISTVGCPSFAVKFSDGLFKIFQSPSQSDAEPWSTSGNELQAEVQSVDGITWKLEIKAKKAISEVWFPWQTQTLVSYQKASDCVVYYPYLFGVAMRGDFRGQWEWWGMEYPGPAFAPLMVLMNEEEATVAAAINWPPKKVRVYYSLLRMSFVYSEKIEPSQMATFQLLFCKAKGNSKKGNYAWHSVVDIYKAWLKNNMKSEGLTPVYSSWMKNINGFINIQLENIFHFNVAEIYDSWNKWGDVFPWVQFWGQMSDYAGNEGGGCCLEKEEMHSRYKPELVQFTKNITGNSGQEAHVGYYARPSESGNDIVTNNAELNYILKWLQKNEEIYCANVSFIDTFGCRYSGNPLEVAKLVKNSFPSDLFIERPIDIYPTAYVVSGCLGAIQRKTLNWAKTPDEISAGKKTAAFPAFGRYLLDDRIIFVGESNGDHEFWGAAGEYWTERQAFLLGAKYDAITIGENKGKSSEMNKALILSLSERKRVSWWQREPVYFDTSGLYNISEGVKVRRFKDKNNKNLFVIDNWNLLINRKFTFDSKIISVPVQKLSIVEVN